MSALIINKLASGRCAGLGVARARYCKEVDMVETTIRFWQEIYDEQGNLVEVHEKYPVDAGHRKV